MGRLEVVGTPGLRFFFTRFDVLVSYIDGRIADAQEPGKAMFLGETVPTGTQYKDDNDLVRSSYNTHVKSILYDGNNRVIFPDEGHEIEIKGNDKLVFDEAVKKFMKREKLDKWLNGRNT